MLSLVSRIKRMVEETQSCFRYTLTPLRLYISFSAAYLTSLAVSVCSLKSINQSISRLIQAQGPHCLPDDSAGLGCCPGRVFRSSLAHWRGIWGCIPGLLRYHRWSRLPSRGLLSEHVVSQLERGWFNQVDDRSCHLYRLYERSSIHALIQSLYPVSRSHSVHLVRWSNHYNARHRLLQSCRLERVLVVHLGCVTLAHRMLILRNANCCRPQHEHFPPRDEHVSHH